MTITVVEDEEEEEEETETVPLAQFTVSSSSIMLGESVTFTDGSTGEVTSYAWSFGDDNTSVAQNPTHTYASAGSYTATLTVTNSAGSSSESMTITVVEDEEEETETAPLAQFTVSSSSITLGESVIFTDGSTGEVTSYAWSFGDDNTSVAQNPTHTYASAGSYTATLTVTNSAGSSSESMTITVVEDEEEETETAPLAQFTVSSSSIMLGESVTFTDGSTGEVTSYAWSFGDDNTSVAQNPTHTYASAGSYTATLTVTNSAGSSSESMTITVVEDTPTSVDVEQLAISIYPNPATDVVNVVANNIVKIAIYNTSGQLVKIVNKKNTATKVSVSKLNKGIYIFMLTTKEGKSVTRKVRVK
ncbi:PKD domain-containing protein [Flammeovirga pectinis]|uniref:PKD domain-containing protein n=1 Tax=Flammeovirga pectinis TaxID=2494373 RepID=A0A3S9P6J7_9BACT|nr:PKD domain-containing protein [Flammeovirga pectinis]AZQ63793.1 PKD domain-containing protein [Flammeovirga pectinis]